MKIVFMGTPEFAARTLQEILNAGYEVSAVVTKEDKPQGRGHKVEFSAVKHLAIENDLTILQPTSLKDEEFANTLKSFEPDVMVVAAYGKILPQNILDIPKFGCVNVHGSLLPKYRGAAPIQYAVLNGDKYAGITTILMDKGMDTGDMLLKKEVELSEAETTGSLYEKLEEVGALLLVETLKKIEGGTITRTKQDEEEATYTSMIDKSMGLINWNKKSKEILNLIRGLNPWPSAYTYYQERLMKIWEAEDNKEIYKKGKTGEIVEQKETGFVVKTGDGSLLITRIQMQDGKAMSTIDFMRGHKIEIGAVLDIEE